MGQSTIKRARHEARVRSIMEIHKCTYEQALARLPIHKKTVKLGKLMGPVQQRSAAVKPASNIERFRKPGGEEEDGDE